MKQCKESRDPVIPMEGTEIYRGMAFRAQTPHGKNTHNEILGRATFLFLAFSKAVAQKGSESGNLKSWTRPWLSFWCGYPS